MAPFAGPVTIMLAILLGIAALAWYRVKTEWNRVQLVADENWPRVDQLKSEYQALQTKATVELDNAVKTLLTKETKKFTWADYATLDAAVTNLTPIDELRRSGWWWRMRFKQSVSTQIYDAYLASKPPDLENDDEKTVRADAIFLVSAVHQTDMAFAAKSLSEVLSSYLLGASVYVTLCLLLLPTLGITVQESVVVLFAGWTGGVFSSQQRLVSDQLADLRRSKLISRLFQGAVLSPVNGAIFAIVLYLFFIAGILKGDLFPAMAPPVGPDQSFFALVTRTAPATVADLAKLLIWAFAAGFAERLVPD